jgi:2-methylcitrate dehydratase PrpD
MSATARAARFVATLDVSTIPSEVVEKARCCILYGLGIGMLCLDQETARVAERAARAFEGAPGPRGATALASGEHASVSAAACANAVLLHSRCQEDTSGTAHLGVVTLSVALALVEGGLGNGADFLPAIVAGYEVGGTLEAALGRDSMKGGHRASAIYGAVAAAATAARLLRLTPAQIDAALANALGFAGGTLQSIPEGSDEWRYQVGVAVRNGLFATSLAQQGSVSARAAVEGPQGFALSFARRPIDVEALGFGAPWRILDVTFKPYPVCAHNQPVALVGAQVHGSVPAARIRALTLRLNPYVVPGMLERGPFSRVPETLMSSAFCCATACLTGSVSMASLSAFDDPAVRSLMDRITIELDDEVPFPSAVAEIETRDGERIVLHEQRRFSDYGLDRPAVVAQLQRLAAEERVSVDAVPLLERFAFEPAPCDPALVVQAYAAAREARPSGAAPHS